MNKEIPDDVMEIARDVFLKNVWHDVYGFIQKQHVECVAEAIMKDRENCRGIDNKKPA